MRLRSDSYIILVCMEGEKVGNQTNFFTMAKVLYGM